MTGYYDYDPPERSPRRTVVGIAALVVGLCAAFLIGYASHGDSPATADPRTGPTGPIPSATSTAAHSAPPAPAQPVTHAELHRDSVGVIVGYRHDVTGAVAAAGNYTASLYVQTNRTHARELAVLSSIAASSPDAARTAGDFSTEDEALAKILGVADLQSDGVIAYGRPQGYRGEAASPSASRCWSATRKASTSRSTRSAASWSWRSRCSHRSE